MASLQQIEQALRAADAAGNVEDARRLAQAYADARRQHTAASDGRPMEIDIIGGTPESVTDDMSGFGRFAAGVGKSLVDTYQGAQQLGAAIQDAIPGVDLTERRRQLQTDIDDRRRLDAPLMDTGAGLAGNITGTAAQILAPGGLLRGTASAAAFLPRTFAGNTAQGGLLGAIQPVESDGSRAANTGLGLLFGGGGYAATAVPGAIGRQAARLSPAFSRGQQERAAADLISGFAANPSTLSASAANAQQIVPGSIPTLAEATGDVGISGLERTLANMPEFGPRLAARRLANNAARVDAVRGGFHGADNSAAKLIRQQTQQAEGPVIRDIKKLDGAQGIKVTRWVDRTLNSPKFRGNPTVEASLGRVRQLVTQPLEDADRLSSGWEVATLALAREARMSPQDQRMLLEARRLVRSGQLNGVAADDVIKEIGRLKPSSLTAQSMLKDVQRAIKPVERGKQDVASLYNARKHVTQTLMPRASGEEMIALRGAVDKLDEQILEVAPSFKNYLSDYAAGMRKADQASVGHRLLGGSNAARDANDNPVLNANFLRRAGDLDQTVRGATGFSRGTAVKTLTRDQLDTIDRVRRDLERQSRAMNDGRAIGSNTVQNAIGGNRVQDAVGPVGAAMVEPVSGVAMLAFNQLRKSYGNRTMEIVQEVMLDPARAAEIMSRLPSRQQRAVMGAIRQLPKVTGTIGRSAVPAFSE